MASYCDVCQGLYFTPHPHLLPQRRSLSCPPQRPTRQATPSRARHFPEHPSSPCAAERSRTPLSCGLTASSFSPSFGAPRAVTPLPRRRRASGNSGSRGHGCAADSSALAFPLSGAGVQGSAPPAESARKGRSFTPPALPLSPWYDRDGGAGDDGAAVLAVTPSRLPGRRYSTDTFSRLRHTDGVAAQCDFLRCGEGVVGSRHPSGPPSRTSPTHWSPLPPSSFFCDSRYPQREQEEAEYCYVDPHPVRELRRGEEEEEEEDERQWQSAQRAWPDERMTSSYGVPHRAGRKAPTDAYDTRSHSRYPSGNGGQSHSRHHPHRHRDVSSSSSCSSGGDGAPREYRSRHHHHRRRRRHSSRRMDAPRSGHLPAVQSTEQGSSGQGVPGPSSPSLLQPTSSPLLTGAGTASLAGDKQMPPLRNQQQQPQPQHQTGDTTADHPAAAAAAAAVSPQLPPDAMGQLMAQIRAEVRKDGAAWLEAQCKKDGGGNSDSMSENNDSDGGGGDSAESRALVAAVLRKVSRTGESKTARTATMKRAAAAAAVTMATNAGEEDRNAAPSLSTSAAPVASTAGSTADAEVDSAASTAEEREGGRRRGQPAVPAQPRHQVHDTAVTEQRPKERKRDELQKDSSERSHTNDVKTASAKARQQYSPPSPPPPPLAAAARTRTASSPCRVRPSSSSSSSRASSSCRSEGSRSASAKQLQRVVAEAEAALEKMRQHRSERKASSRRRTPHPVMTGAEEERKNSRETAARPSSRRDTRQRRENEEAERPLPAEALQSIAAALEGKLEHQQEAWCTAQAHRIERLREGLSSLCSAVHKDLRKMRAEVDAARETANSAKADAAAAAAVNAGVRTQPIPSPKPQSDADRVAALPPSCVLTWVSQCSREEQRRLAHILLPHLRPELSDVIAAEVQRQLGEREADQQQRLRDTETRLHAVVEEAVSTAQAAQSSHGPTPPVPSAAAPLWAAFSSADAFDAHLRSTARAVLLEEDDRRYSLANDNERRHEMRTRELQRHWEATLHDAQHAWRAEWRAILAETQEGWLRKAQAPLQKHADVLQDVVTALTRDVTHLQAQLNTQAASLQTAMQTEREMRQREHAKTTELVESRVRAWLPREVETACVRHHTQRERSAATAAAAGSPPSLHTSRSQHLAEELRLSVVQPALDHMRRLLASHQELVNASVEDRCTRAESAVEGSRHVWLQNVTELRGKVSALRSDVRGAFHELCDGLNVASPAL